MKKNKIVTAIILALSLKFVYAEYITPEQLLERYEVNRNLNRSFIFKGEDLEETKDTAYGDEYRGLVLTEYEFRIDVERIDIITNTYFNLQNPEETASAEHSSKVRNIWDGTTSSYCSYKIAPRVSQAVISKQKKNITNLVTGYTGAPLDGIFTGDRQPIDIVFSEASDIDVRPEMEKVNGFNCYVIDAVTPYGKYNLWIDPEHGYNIAKAKVHKSGSDILYDKPINQYEAQSVPKGLKYNGILFNKRSEFFFELNVIEFQKINNVWFPAEASFQTENRYVDGRIVCYKTHHKRTNIDPNPDFEAIAAFVPDFPEGTRVYIEEAPGINYTWQNGKLIADVDNFVIEQLDKAAQEIMDEESVPTKLGSVSKTDASDDETDSIPDTQPETHADISEAQRDILSQSHALPVIVLILIGLLIIGVVGWLVFSKLRTLEK